MVGDLCLRMFHIWNCHPKCPKCQTVKYLYLYFFLIICLDYNEHRTFLTIPRLNFGVPFSLATVVKTDRRTEINPKVEPYPSYVWHHSHGSNCTGITSALRTYVSKKTRLIYDKRHRTDILQLFFVFATTCI